MKSTYMNERMTDTYPFVPGTVLPFSYGCISDLRVCLRLKEELTVAEVRVTSVQITADSVTVTVCLQSNMFMCQATAEPQSSAVTYATNDMFEGSVILTIGHILPADYGSYATNLTLEPGCVCIIPAAVYTGTNDVRINGRAMPLEEVLSVRTAGYYDTSLSRTNATQMELRLRAKVPTAAVLTVQPDANNYAMVQQVNTVKIEQRSTLVIFIACQADGYSDSVLGYTLSGELFDESEAPESAGHGAYVYLTLHGTHLVPNCYTEQEDGATIVTA